MTEYRIVWILDTFSPALWRVEDGVDDLSPVMSQIADYMLGAVRERFKEGKAPDGTPWAPKKRTTIEAHRRKEGLKKNPKDTRPLFGPTGNLHSQFHPFYDRNSAGVATNVLYAAVHQLGAKKGSLGSYSGTNKNGHPYSGIAPWGDIPARPFFGLSEDDRINIEAYLVDYITAVRDGA